MTQDCNTCKETKPLELYHMNSSLKGRRPRCRSCDSRAENRPGRVKSRTAPRTVACGLGKCLEAYTSKNGASQHRLRAHGIYAGSRVESSRDLTPEEATKIASIRLRAIRGSGDGNIDSAGLLDLLFVVGRKRVAA